MTLDSKTLLDCLYYEYTEKISAPSIPPPPYWDSWLSGHQDAIGKVISLVERWDEMKQLKGKK